MTNEKVAKIDGGYAIALHQKNGMTGILTLKLDELAATLSKNTLESIRTHWKAEHPDLAALSIVGGTEYASLPIADQKLCLVVTAPATEAQPLHPAFHNQSIYVVAKGIGHILSAYADAPESDQAKLFERDFRELNQLLAQQGFVGYPMEGDFVFEQRGIFGPLLHATREEFNLYGAKKLAWMELCDVEQRIIAQNKIETQIHEELLKWKDEYQAAVVSLNSAVRYDVPQPTKNVFWSNLRLTLAKMFRGDERKVLRWGLDLSGGKSVQIELRDQNNQIVKEDADIKQGINELFDRVNKMGVSDVSIRQVGHHIALDFPGSQALSASELIRASSMYFHIVNEKFGPMNTALAQSTDRFLQEVWNEAIVFKSI